MFSPDGTKVAFVSRADDLGPSVPATGHSNVYVRDLAAGTTTLASLDAAGSGGGNGHSERPAYLDDTRLVFESTADDLGPTDTNRHRDIYVRDLASGTTRLLTANASGTDSSAGPSDLLDVSPDGRLVAFDSLHGSFGTPPSSIWQLYVVDTVSGAVELVSVDQSGESPATGHRRRGMARASRSSADGRHLAFGSHASNLVSRDTNGTADIFVRDLASRSTRLVSSNGAGSNSANGSSSLVTFAGDDLVFKSRASDLGPQDPGNDDDIYAAHLAGADLAVAASAGPEPVVSGSELAYSVSVRNEGPDVATDPVVAVMVPEGTTLLSASSSTECAPDPSHPRAMLCPTGDMAVGATLDVEVVVRVDAAPGSTLEAIVIGSSGTPDSIGPNVVAITSTVVGPP